VTDFLVLRAWSIFMHWFVRYKRLQRRWNLTAEEICCHWSILCTLLFKSCCFLLSVSQSFSSESPTGADCCNARVAIEINIRFSQEFQSPLSLRGLKISTWDCSFKSISSSNSKMACVSNCWWGKCHSGVKMGLPL